jgi:hypothetical protein
MATKTVVLLSDDLDGSEAAETVSFGLDGRSFEIDLSQRNAARLRESMARFVAAAHKTGGRTRPRGRKGSTGAFDPKAVREWANSHGLDINARGRISSVIVEQFRAAQERGHEAVATVTDIVDEKGGKRARRGRRR